MTPAPLIINLPRDTKSFARGQPAFINIDTPTYVGTKCTGYVLYEDGSSASYPGTQGYVQWTLAAPAPLGIATVHVECVSPYGNYLSGPLAFTVTD